MIDFVKDTQYPCLGYGIMCVVLRQLQVWQQPVPGCLRGVEIWLVAVVRGANMLCGAMLYWAGVSDMTMVR